MRASFLCLGLIAACSKGGGDSPADTDRADDSDVVDTDGGTTDTNSDTDLPPDPRPLTIAVHGGYEGSLVFDQPDCTAVTGAPQFRAFWRNGSGAHVFVLIAEVIGPYDGPGEYTQDQSIVRAKLQEEAGGNGNFFATDTTQGDTVTIDVDQVTDTEAWGSFTVGGMHGDAGAITIDPTTIPIWCPELNQ
jgi:hypothetical protein